MSTSSTASLIELLDRLCAQFMHAVNNSNPFFNFFPEGFAAHSMAEILSAMDVSSGLSESVANERREWFVIPLAQALHEVAARLVKMNIGFVYLANDDLLGFQNEDGTILRVWGLPHLGLMRMIAAIEFRNWIALQQRKNQQATMLEIVSALMKGGLSRGFSAALLHEYNRYLRKEFPEHAEALIKDHLKIRTQKDEAKTLDGIIADIKVALDPTARLLAVACRLLTMNPEAFKQLVAAHPAYFDALRATLAKHEFADTELPDQSSAAESLETVSALFAQFDTEKGPATIEFQVGNILKSAASSDASTGAVNYRKALAQMKSALSAN